MAAPASLPLAESVSKIASIIESRMFRESRNWFLAVRLVPAQHIEDEPLLDRLAHRVHVKRPGQRPGSAGPFRPNNVSVFDFGVAVKAR